jgi:hypothetical protein
VLANPVNEKNTFSIPKNDEKLAKKQDFREQKNAPLGKKSRFFKKYQKTMDSISS